MRLRRLFFVLLAFLASVVGARTQVAAPKPNLQVCETMYARGPLECLTEIDKTPLAGRIPVLLIHGWANLNGPDLPEGTTWDNLLSYTSGVPWVAEKYKFYEVSYFSNLVSVFEIARVLALLVDDMDHVDLDFAKRQIVIIGHSMGGLVGRSFMEEQYLQFGRGMVGGDRVLRLVTLATPHHGTPVANSAARNAAAGFLVGNLVSVFDNNIFASSSWDKPNRSDLRDDGFYPLLDFKRFPGDRNDWLVSLNTYFLSFYQRKIMPFAGEVDLADSYWKCEPFDFSTDCLAPILGDTLGVWQSDGIVPLTSAFFEDCIACPYRLKLWGYNHSQMARGKLSKDSNLFGAILGVLSDLVADSDARFDGTVIMGNTTSEQFHNLRGWGDAHGSVSNTSRDQVIGGTSSVDLFIPKPFVSKNFSFTVEDGQCDDSWELYVNDNLVWLNQHKSSQPLSTITMTLAGKYFPSRRVTVTFVNRAKDTCGHAAGHSVRLF